MILIVVASTPDAVIAGQSGVAYWYDTIVLILPVYDWSISAITGEHNNQNQIWCVNMGEYIIFRSNRGF